MVSEPAALTPNLWLDSDRLAREAAATPATANEARARRALELRAMGRTWNAVAQTLGYSSASTARRAVRRILPDAVPDRDELRAASLNRLQETAARMHAEAMATGSATHARVLAQVEQVIAGIVGLNAPAEHHVTVEGHDRYGDGQAITHPSRWLAAGGDLTPEHIAVSGFTPAQIEAMRTEARARYGDQDDGEDEDDRVIVVDVDDGES